MSDANERLTAECDPRCGAQSPDPEGFHGFYICTRSPHAEGRHVAHGVAGQPLAFWVDGGQVEEVGE